MLAGLFGGALAGIVHASVTPIPGSHDATVNVNAWRALFADPVFLDSLWFTVRLSASASLLASGLALGVTLLLRRRGIIAHSLATLPVPVPHLIVAVVAVLWLAPGGLAERILGGLPADVIRDRYGAGIVLVYVYKEAPFIILLLLAAIDGDLHEREEAAAVLGASPFQRLRWVIFPAVRRPLVVGGVVIAAFVLGAFEVPLAVGPNYPPTLAEYALQATQNDVLAGQGTAAAALLIAAVVSITLGVLAVSVTKDPQGD